MSLPNAVTQIAERVAAALGTDPSARAIAIDDAAECPRRRGEKAR